MKIAEARFTGNDRSHYRKCPSGRTYTLRRYPGNPDRDELEPQAIEHVDDAEFLAAQPNIEVDWTPIGRLKAASEDAVAAVADLGYSAKQRLVGKNGFDLDVPGNADEDTLEDELQAHVEDLIEEGDL